MSSVAPGDCVEVAELTRAIAVRDSKDPTGPVLAFERPLVFLRLPDAAAAMTAPASCCWDPFACHTSSES